MQRNISSISIILILSFSIILCSADVYAVGVSPSKIKISFEPNFVYEGVVRFNTGGNTNHLSLSAGGDFNITLEKNDVYCDTEYCEVKYKISLPESYETPGLKKGYITGTEAYDDDPSGFMAVIVSITFPIYVTVPYPGKYMEWVSFTADNVAAGNTTRITGILISKGTDTVNNMAGKILIFDSKNNLIGSANTNIVRNVVTDQTVTLGAKWDSGEYKQGNYRAEMMVDYDEEETNNTASFKLGGLDVSMINYSKEIYLGGIKSFFVTVDSIWSDDIKDVRANISIYNYSSSATQPITSFETLTKPLPAWGTETLLGYIDTSLLNVSVYDAKIKLYFADQVKEYDAKVNITLPPKIIEPKKKLDLLSTKNILIALVAVLVIALVVLIYAFLPKKKKQNPSSPSNPTTSSAAAAPAQQKPAPIKKP